MGSADAIDIGSKMGESVWKLNRPAVEGENFGRPVSKRGIFLSRAKVPPAIIRKAGEVLDALFKFQETHDFEVCEDSEHLLVFVDLKNGFTVAYEEMGSGKAKLLDSSGALVGYLTKT